MLSLTTAPPMPPGARVIDGITPVVAPIAPSVPHVLTRMRNAGFSIPNAMITSSSVAWMTSECPSPPKRSSSIAALAAGPPAVLDVPAEHRGELLRR